MSNDTIISILFVCLLAMAFGTGALMGSLRRDTEWRRWIGEDKLRASLKKKEEDEHWESAIRDPWN